MTPAVDDTARRGRALAGVSGATATRAAARVGSWLLIPALWVAVSAIAPRIPGPVPVAQAFVEELSSGELLTHFWISLWRLAIGMAIAIVLGLAIGILLGAWRVFDLLLTGPAIAALAIPSIIWALLATMWFGFGDTAPIFTVVVSAVPFVAVNIATGVQAIPTALTRMSTAFRVPWWRRLGRLTVPAVMGYLFAGGRLALVVGWQALLLSEWFGAVDGGGFRARYWYDANQLDGTLAWVAFFIIFILLLDRVLIERTSRWVFRWRSPESGAQPTSQEA